MRKNAHTRHMKLTWDRMIMDANTLGNTRPPMNYMSRRNCILNIMQPTTNTVAIARILFRFFDRFFAQTIQRRTRNEMPMKRNASRCDNELIYICELRSQNNERDVYVCVCMCMRTANVGYFRFQFWLGEIACERTNTLAFNNKNVLIGRCCLFARMREREKATPHCNIKCVENF